jgi:hypothetical protein
MSGDKSGQVGRMTEQTSSLPGGASFTLLLTMRFFR